MNKQSLELLLEQGTSIERIAKRFGKDPATVSYWVRKHGLRSPYADKHAARGGIERERLAALVERAEAQKCLLLCATCHAEVENGVASVPARVPAYHPDADNADG